jgi:hypothetical protein
MQKVVIFGVLGALFFLPTPATRAQDSDEVAKLRRENELLKKEIELLKKEVELLKKEAKAKPEGAGDPKTEEKPRTKATELGFVEYELVKCVRDPKVRTRVTFSFAVRDEFGKANVETVHGCKGMTLTTSGGKALEGKVVYVSNNMVRLTKGEWSKFQVTYEGVDEDTTSFEEVGLTMGSQFGIPRAALNFYRIKIEPK